MFLSSCHFCDIFAFLPFTLSLPLLPPTPVMMILLILIHVWYWCVCSLSWWYFTFIVIFIVFCIVVFYMYYYGLYVIWYGKHFKWRNEHFVMVGDDIRLFPFCTFYFHLLHFVDCSHITFFSYSHVFNNINYFDIIYLILIFDILFFYIICLLHIDKPNVCIWHFYQVLSLQQHIMCGFCDVWYYAHFYILYSLSIILSVISAAHILSRCHRLSMIMIGRFTFCHFCRASQCVVFIVSVCRSLLLLPQCSVSAFSCRRACSVALYRAFPLFPRSVRRYIFVMVFSRRRVLPFSVVICHIVLFYEIDGILSLGVIASGDDTTRAFCTYVIYHVLSHQSSFCHFCFSHCHCVFICICCDILYVLCIHSIVSLFFIVYSPCIVYSVYIVFTFLFCFVGFLWWYFYSVVIFILFHSGIQSIPYSILLNVMCEVIFVIFGVFRCHSVIFVIFIIVLFLVMSMFTILFLYYYYTIIIIVEVFCYFAPPFTVLLHFWRIFTFYRLLFVTFSTLPVKKEEMTLLLTTYDIIKYLISILYVHILLLLYCILFHIVL